MLSIYKLGSILGSIQDHLLGSTKYYKISPSSTARASTNACASSLCGRYCGLKRLSM